MLPTLQQTKELYDFATSKTNVLNRQMGLPEGVSAVHYQNVAFIAATIAEAAGLETQKAYILGLLHDYGEYIEDTVAGTFHGTAGYDEMIKLGFDEVARTCLSHSFFDASFTPEDYASYDRSEITRARKLIEENGLDDYDRLIHIADLMAPGLKIDTVENRIAFIVDKYHVEPVLGAQKLRDALALKSYFDAKCGCNIYSLFNL